MDGEIYDEYPGKRTVEALSKYVDDNMPGTVVWLDKNGKPERQKGVAAEEASEERSVAAASATTTTTTTTTAPGSVLHMEKNEDEATPSLEDSLQHTSSSSSAADSSETLSLIDDDAAAVEAKAGIEHELDEISSKSATQEVPVLLTQFIKTNLESKRATGAARPDGEMHALKGDLITALSREDGPPAFVKFYAPW